MEKDTIYISLEQSILVGSRKIHIGDIATIYCRNQEIAHSVRKLEITTFPAEEESQVVITAMKLIEIISKNHPEIHIEVMGNPETIVYYKNLRQGTKTKGKIKAIFLMLIAFFGTAYSIMAYNQDVASTELLSNLYTLFTGSNKTDSSIGYIVGVVTYSIGLCIGMIVFFNHGINRKTTDDPTPLQVQMRLYEQEVNQCIIIDSSREHKTIDAD
ncbi:MAG: stage V sporulation protein AA [Lachnospiraceae bacterium]|nr:stage V sporulation protein AA [Lachnospiraceae bacterium]